MNRAPAGPPAARFPRRFHADVQATIDRVPMEVDELAVPLTDNMRQIQAALLELIDTCLFDLRRANPTVPGAAPCRAPSVCVFDQRRRGWALPVLRSDLGGRERVHGRERHLSVL